MSLIPATGDRRSAYDAWRLLLSGWCLALGYCFLAFGSDAMRRAHRGDGQWQFFFRYNQDEGILLSALE